MRKLTLFLFALAATVSVATSSFACSMLLCGVGSTGSAASSFSLTYESSVGNGGSSTGQQTTAR